MIETKYFIHHANWCILPSRMQKQKITHKSVEICINSLLLELCSDFRIFNINEFPSSYYVYIFHDNFNKYRWLFHSFLVEINGSLQQMLSSYHSNNSLYLFFDIIYIALYIWLLRPSLQSLASFFLLSLFLFSFLKQFVLSVQITEKARICLYNTNKTIGL